MDNLEQNKKGNNMTTEDDINFVNEVLAEENCISTNKEFVMLFDDCRNGQLLRAFMLSELINRFKKNNNRIFKCTNKTIKDVFHVSMYQIKRAKADLVKKGFISIERRYYITVNIETIYKELSKLNNKQS